MRVPKIKIKGVYYHGSAIQEHESMFKRFRSDYSDWGAVWFSSNEHIAEEFSDNQIRSDNDVKIIYKVILNSNAIANITYDIFEKILEHFELEDLREFIPLLKEKNYKGWETIGSIGAEQYDDIAIFDTSVIKLDSVKLFIKGKWTDYMNIDDAEHLLTQQISESFIKQLLRERLLTKEPIDIRAVSDFVNFAKEYLGITDDIKVALAFERTPDIKTTAYYSLDGRMVIYAKNRAIIDVCRSIAHELVHHKQNLEGRLKNAKSDGEDGSPIENEANSVAGIIIRKYGKLHPEIYE